MAEAAMKMVPSELTGMVKHGGERNDNYRVEIKRNRAANWTIFSGLNSPQCWLRRHSHGIWNRVAQIPRIPSRAASSRRPYSGLVI